MPGVAASAQCACGVLIDSAVKRTDIGDERIGRSSRASFAEVFLHAIKAALQDVV
jgi:hypothetical protein